VNFRQLRHTLHGKLGASEDREKDHVYYYLSIGDKDHRVSKVSHSSRGSDKVEEYIILDTAHRMKLSKGEFSQFVNCSLNKDDYTKLWQERA